MKKTILKRVVIGFALVVLVLTGAISIIGSNKNYNQVYADENKPVFNYEPFGFIYLSGTPLILKNFESYNSYDNLCSFTMNLNYSYSFDVLEFYLDIYNDCCVTLLPCTSCNASAFITIYTFDEKIYEYDTAFTYDMLSCSRGDRLFFSVSNFDSFDNDIALNLDFEYHFFDNYLDSIDDYYNNVIDTSNAQKYQEGYQEGYQKGSLDKALEFNDLMDDKYSGESLFWSIINAPVRLLDGIFCFDIFGINVANIIKVVISLAIVGLIIKKVVL